MQFSERHANIKSLATRMFVPQLRLSDIKATSRLVPFEVNPRVISPHKGSIMRKTLFIHHEISIARIIFRYS